MRNHCRLWRQIKKHCNGSHSNPRYIYMSNRLESLLLAPNNLKPLLLFFTSQLPNFGLLHFITFNNNILRSRKKNITN